MSSRAVTTARAGRDGAHGSAGPVCRGDLIGRSELRRSLWAGKMRRLRVAGSAFLFYFSFAFLSRSAICCLAPPATHPHTQLPQDGSHTLSLTRALCACLTRSTSYTPLDAPTTPPHHCTHADSPPSSSRTHAYTYRHASHILPVSPPHPQTPLCRQAAQRAAALLQLPAQPAKRPAAHRPLRPRPAHSPLPAPGDARHPHIPRSPKVPIRPLPHRRRTQ